MTEALTRAARAVAAYTASTHASERINYAGHARAAILSFLDGEDVVEACARAMTHEHWPGESAEFRATRLEVSAEKAQRAIAALRALVQEETE